MKISIAAKLIFWVAAIFAIGILLRAESGQKSARTPNTKGAPLRIVDQNGRPAVNGVASPNGQIVDVAVGPDFAFHPDTVNISVGDTVRWTWAGSGHSVTSGQPCAADSQFCSPDDMNCAAGVLSNVGTVYTHTFAAHGTYHYFCASHCIAGMTGVVNVVSPSDTIFYGSTGDVNASGGGRLWLIDVTTQGAFLIGDTGFDRLGGIAFDGNGTLYGVAGGATHPPSTLLTIDPTNGQATVIGLISDLAQGVDGLRFNSQGVLYGVSWDNNVSVGKLLTIAPSNGDVLTSLTLVGDGDSFCAGIAFDPLGLLYGSRGNGSRDEDIDLIDQVTGVLTPLGPLETIISDVAFAPDGTLYSSSPMPTQGDLYSIDPVTGAKT